MIECKILRMGKLYVSVLAQWVQSKSRKMSHSRLPLGKASENIDALQPSRSSVNQETGLKRTRVESFASGNKQAEHINEDPHKRSQSSPEQCCTSSQHSEHQLGDPVRYDAKPVRSQVVPKSIHNLGFLPGDNLCAQIFTI